MIWLYYTILLLSSILLGKGAYAKGKDEGLFVTKNWESGRMQEVDGSFEEPYEYSYTIECTLHELHTLPSDVFDATISAERIADIAETYVCIDTNSREVYNVISSDDESMDIEDIVLMYLDGVSPILGVTTISISSNCIDINSDIDDRGALYQMRPVIDLSCAILPIATSNKEHLPNTSSLEQSVSKGEHSVAVIRVIGKGGSAPSKSAKQLSDDIFGTNGDVLNLRSGYQICSNNQLDLIPGTGNGLVDGVYELTLSKRTSGVTTSTVESWVTSALVASGITEDHYDYFIYVFPSDVDFGSKNGVAYAYLPGTISVYKDTYSSKYLALMHEVGHNLGHHHSGYNSNSYGDSSCWMGRSFFSDEGPKMCFNGAKSYYFGWYSDRHLEVQPSKKAHSIQLTGIDDYVNDVTKEGQHVVVLRLYDFVHDDLYVMYNSAKGINSGVTYRNRVMIVSQSGPQEKSWLQGWLQKDDDETFVYEDWTGEKGEHLTITLCSAAKNGSPAIARIIVYVEGLNSIGCDETASPTMSPAPSLSPKIHASYFESDSTWTQLPPEGLHTMTPYMTEMVQSINFINKLGDFAGSGRDQDIAALFEGSLMVQVRGKYEICILSDDGSKLYFNDELLINNDGLHGARRKCKNKVMEVGTKKIVIEYFERGLEATLVLEWTLPRSTTRVVIPPEAWAPTPSTNGTDCEEDGDDEFLFKLIERHGDLMPVTKTKTCSWLNSKPSKVESICASTENFGDLLPASFVCKRTCSGCSSSAPTPTPTNGADCEEDGDDEFLFKLIERHGDIMPVTKTCSWLNSKPSKTESTCASTTVFGDLMPASVVCQKTCGGCPPTPSPTEIGGCVENKDDLFLFKIKEKGGSLKAVSKPCNWLQSTPSKIEATCASTDQLDGLLPASTICPKTCGTCPSLVV